MNLIKMKFMFSFHERLLINLDSIEKQKEQIIAFILKL